MHARRLVQFVALACSAALLFGAAARLPAINAGRTQLNLMGAASPVANAPPEYVFYIQAFGAFRGLIADIAFIRAEQLKEQARFFDAHQLHRWICELQPRFPSVWEYCSWNMAWNISVTTFTPEERWNWVYNGVKLLRDEGIPLNPRAVNLYKQLAWTFNNKMSEPTDEFHYAYKCNWAWRMHLLLGPPPQPFELLDVGELAQQTGSDKEADVLAAAARRSFERMEELRRASAEFRGEVFQPRALPDTVADPNAGAAGGALDSFRVLQAAGADVMRGIRDAAPNLTELYARAPDARRMVAELRELGIRIEDDLLTEDRYWSPTGLAFAFFKPYRELLAPTLEQRLDPTAGPDGPREKLGALLGVAEQDPAGLELVRFLQRKVLLEVYKMDPAYMLQVVEHFGPVDWRSVDATAAYWIVRGLVASDESISKFGNDKTNTIRIIFFCLRNLFLRNQIVFEPDPERIYNSYLNLGLDLNFVEPMHEAYLKYGPYFDPDAGPGEGAGDTYRSGHVNFLTEAIRALYMAGRDAEADHYYRYLQAVYGRDPFGQPHPAYTKTLRDFVMDSYDEIARSVMGWKEINQFLQSFLMAGYNRLAGGEFAAYARLRDTASEYHRKFMEDKDDPSYVRVRLPPFEQIELDAFRSALTQQAIGRSGVLHKMRLWRNARLELRQGVYDEVLASVRAECDALQLDVNRVIPEPRGMADYRKLHPGRPEAPGAPRESEVETPAQRLNS